MDNNVEQMRKRVKQGMVDSSREAYNFVREGKKEPRVSGGMKRLKP